MEDRLAADLAEVAVDAGAVLVVAALADHEERTELRFSVGDRHLRHGARVDDERPALVVLLLQPLGRSQIGNLGPSLGGSRFRAHICSRVVRRVAI